MSNKILCLIDEITWIPIEEELPEYENIPVLFWIMEKTNGNNPGCYVGYYSNRIFDGKKGRWFDIWGKAIYLGVTHWAALPKGPDCTLRIGLD